MEHILSAAEQILRNSGAPALRLSALLDELVATTGARALDAARLRALLEGRPDRFRILDPWRGPWRFVGRDAEASSAEPWVVVVRDLGDGAGAPGRSGTLRMVRESVRWLGLHVDARSPRRVMRWEGLVLEGTAAARALRSAA